MLRKISTIVALALVMVFIGQVGSQAKENSLKAGAWALQFEFVPADFDLKSYEGSMLSIKMHTSANWAWKLGLSVSTNTSDGAHLYYKADTLNSRSNRDAKHSGFMLKIQRLWYSKPTASTNLFIGLGPMYEHRTDSQTDYQISAYYPNGNIRYNEYTKNGYGLVAVIGVEWFASKTVSLSADYSTELRWDKVSTIYDNIYEDEPARNSSREVETDYFIIRNNAVRVGLSLYF